MEGEEDSMEGKKWEKDRAWKKKHYQKMRKDCPEILQMKAHAQKIKCLEDLEYGVKDAQRNRKSRNKRHQVKLITSRRRRQRRR